MPVEQEELNALRKSHAAWIGGDFGEFYCPILEETGTGERGLMNAHIVNKAVKQASRKQVIQRADIDGYYGTTIEPDFVNLVNLHHEDPRDLVRQHRRDLRAVASDGREFDVVYASRPDRLPPPFPQFALTEAERKLVGTPYVKLPSDVGVDETFTLRTGFFASDPAFTGALLKSAYLALFDVFRYRIVADPRMRVVRNALAGFFRDRAGKDQAERYFGRFKGAANGLTYDGTGLGDTMTDRIFLAHSFPNVGALALSVLLRANHLTFAVAMPITFRQSESAAADAAYEALLRGDADGHEVRLARYDEARDGFSLEVPVPPTS